MTIHLPHNISSVRTDCYSCGICATVCPAKCISYQLSKSTGSYAVEVDNEKCTKCGICRKVCPVLNTEQTVVNPMEHAINAYAGYSANADIRRNAASGGFITSFLLFLLDNGYIDGALITRRNGVVGQSYIATTKKEIINSKTSIYAPVDYANGLKELKDSSCKRIAVVGLPCHIQAISNWAKINKNISSKLFIKIAIVCGKTPSTHAYQYIAKKVGFNYNSISSVRNRGDGWPGYMTIQHQNGKYKTSYRSGLSMGSVLSSPFLCNRGCLSCIDGLGVSADLSVCDAWLEKYTKKKDAGWNLVLSLTETADILLKKRNIDSFLFLKDEITSNFYHANKRVIDKSYVGNAMRRKENKILIICRLLPMKSKIYVLAMKILMRLFRPDKINYLELAVGKAINKLKA